MNLLAETLLGLLVGFGLDVLIGWPAWLYARIGHPVGWFAAPVSALEKRWNQSSFSDRRRCLSGALLSVTAILSAALLWGALGAIARQLPFAPLWLGLLFWPLIAARSMHEHVAAIARPLAQGDLAGARHAVSMIVGRDPSALDAAGVARASLESLGENTSDGIVAPIFWGVLLGPAGMAGYKAINTLDSMIAHRNARYEWFGKLAARIDDVANLIPARLTGLLYALSAGRHAPFVLSRMGRDASAHRSPNAGWAETGLAAAIGVRLSGPRIYGGVVSPEPWLNGEAPDPDAEAILRGLQHYRRLLALLAAGIGGLWGVMALH